MGLFTEEQLERIGRIGREPLLPHVGAGPRSPEKQAKPTDTDIVRAYYREGTALDAARALHIARNTAYRALARKGVCLSRGRKCRVSEEEIERAIIACGCAWEAHVMLGCCYETVRVRARALGVPPRVRGRKRAN